MEIYHRISINSKKRPDFLAVIQKLKIKHQSVLLPGGENSLISFDISESDSNWTEISELAKSSGIVGIVETFFSDDEIKASEWVRMIPVVSIGYPQPEQSWTEEHPTYENYCSQCGTYTQKVSFRVKDSMHLRKNDIGTLYWTYATLCSKSVCDELNVSGFSGFECLDVILHKSNQPSTNLKQIAVPKIAYQALISDEPLNSTKCSECGSIKYLPHMKGVMKLTRQSLDVQP
ncbi:MAG: hypothetical protein QM730_23155 [Anaerolineales bacterium]